MPRKKVTRKLKNVDKPSAQPSGTKERRLVPQPHGGALIPGQGGGRENGLKGGRPASEMRARMVGSLSTRLGVAEAIADGAPIKRASISLAAVLKHARCPVCEGKLEKLAEIKDGDEILVQMHGLESATPGDRMKALDFFAKYGVGTKDEVTLVSPEVRERLERTVTLISERETWTADDLLTRLDEVWSE